MHTTEQLNTALGDRYRIDRRVGAGGMATVYLARDLKHDREVALKVLNPELGAVLGVERFLSEIRVTANLQHPNLLPLFDSGEANGLLYYVMPYVAGESLRAKLDREKQLPVDDAIRIATAVANALDYAHRRNVIHRDLKPENILLHEGQPLIADFGIALAVSKAGGARITQTGLSLGTPQYMSPEQATGDRAIDGRSDIYSLGAVLYEMLTAEPPHTGTTAQSIIARVLTERPRAIRATRPSVSAELEAAVDRALEKLPADRYPTAGEFAAALLRPSAGTALSPRAPTASRMRRIAVLVAVALGVAALGIAIGSGLMPPTSGPVEFEGELLGGSTIAFNSRVSPDGQTVAFVAMVDGQSQLAVLTPGTGSWTLLTRDRTRGVVDDLAWSLDGKRIFFDRIHGGPHGVFSIPALGGDERLVIDRAASPQVLPDNSILVRRINANGQSQLMRYWPETSRMDTLPAFGGAGFLGTFFRALPNGREVAFYGKPASDTVAPDHLAILDLETKQVRRIAGALAITPPHWRFPLAVSADGSEILFDLIARDLHRIVAVPRDGSHDVRTLVTLTSATMGLDVGRDGSLYLDQGSQLADLLWYAPATGRLERMPIPSSAGPPLVLSDGRVLVTTHAGGRRVLVVAPGREARPLLDLPVESNSPMVQVGPDRVALVLGTAPNRKIGLASMTTGQIVGQVDSIDAERIVQLAATPDGKTLFYVADHVVWAVATEGGPSRRVRRGDGVAVHPDGNYLVIKLDEREGVRLVRVAWPQGTESPIRLNEGPLKLAFDDFASNAIARDGRILVRVGSAASWYWPIAILNPETGALSIVGSTFEDMLAGGWAPDGRVVARAGATLASLWRFRPLR